jgi:tetratricopeptide (TPR) repeat protein
VRQPASTAGTSPRFSVVVLARDEAQTLPRLFRSLGSFFSRGGEVLLLDTGSCDDTVSVARAAGCRVESAPARFDSALDPADAAELERRFARDGEGPLVSAGQRLFHFGDARQHASLLASQDIVLQLDASDEVLALALDVLEGHLRDGADAFAYDLLNGNVRLHVSRFSDRRRYRWAGRVHETLEPIGPDSHAAARTVRCDTADLLVRHHKNEGKTRHYLAGLALQAIERPREPRWWHYLGRELFYAGWYRSAVAVLEAHAGMDAAWAAERSQSLCLASECFDALGLPAEAQDACHRAIALDRTRREPFLRLAGLHSRRGEFDESTGWAYRALTVRQVSGYPEPDDYYTWVPHSLLYWGLFWLGRRDEAREHWETCRRLVPENVRILEHLRLFGPRSA